MPHLTQTLTIPQLARLETGLMDCVSDLKTHKRIFGTAPTLEDLLNPVEEKEIGDSAFSFPGRDVDIVAAVMRETTGGDKAAREDRESDDENEPDVIGLSFGEGGELCQQLEKACVLYSDADGVKVLELQAQLWKLHRHF